MDTDSRSLKIRAEDEIGRSEDESKGDSRVKMETQREEGGLLEVEHSEEMLNPFFQDLQDFIGLRSCLSSVDEMQPLLSGLSISKDSQPSKTIREQRVKATKQKGRISSRPIKTLQGQGTLTQLDSGDPNGRPSPREESLTRREILLLRKRKQEFEDVEREVKKRRGTC